MVFAKKECFTSARVNHILRVTKPYTKRATIICPNSLSQIGAWDSLHHLDQHERTSEDDYDEKEHVVVVRLEHGRQPIECDTEEHKGDCRAWRTMFLCSFMASSIKMAST
jgi:hypothetical protein